MTKWPHDLAINQVGLSAGFLVGFVVMNSIEAGIELVTKALKHSSDDDALQVPYCPRHDSPSIDLL